MGIKDLQMKYNPNVTSSRRKNRKAYFEANMEKRRKSMSAPLYHNLKKKYSVNSAPVCSGDQVRIVRGMFRGHEGKVIGVYRNKWFIMVECAIKKKSNAQDVKFGINPSNCIITKLADAQVSRYHIKMLK